MFKRTLVLMAAASVLLTGCYDTGGGKKVGMITKVAQEGVVCKTYEAQIQRGGFNGGSGVNGQAFGFTIENPELVKKVEDLMTRQVEVELTYSSELVSFCRSENHSHFLVDIKELTKDPVAQEVKTQNVVPGSVAWQPGDTAALRQKMSGDTEDKMLEMLRQQNEMLQQLIQERRNAK